MNKVWMAAFLFLVLPLAAQEPVRTAVAPPEHQDPSAEPQPMALWDGKAPGALGDAESDRPTLTLYAASSRHEPTAAVIVLPGGSYQNLATNHEGRQIANWLNALGITSFVLKYRLGPRYHHPIELGDAQRAIRMVRARAKEFNVLPDRIGILGFSAGGHLASTAETHFDGGDLRATHPIHPVSARPGFPVLAHPVISLIADYANKGSWKNLLGRDATPDMR